MRSFLGPSLQPAYQKHTARVGAPLPAELLLNRQVQVDPLLACNVCSCSHRAENLNRFLWEIEFLFCMFPLE